MTEAADLSTLHVAVPPGIRAVIARQIGYLGDGTAQAIDSPSHRPEFDLDVLRQVGEYGQDDAADLLDEAVAANLLTHVAGVRGRYRFAHDLVRETLYEELSPSRRTRLHGRIATVLEERSANSTETYLAELAHHFAMAAVGGRCGPESGDRRRWVRRRSFTQRLAGDDAARSLAYEEAARLYRMALAGLEVMYATMPHAPTSCCTSGTSRAEREISTLPERNRRDGGPGAAAGRWLCSLPEQHSASAAGSRGESGQRTG